MKTTAKTSTSTSKASSAKAPKSAPVKKVSKPQAPKKGNVAPLAHGVGRRKSAVARVWVRTGKGAFTVNGKEALSYFDNELSRFRALSPWMLLPHLRNDYDLEVNVIGGGMNSQADAVKLGISRALIQVREEAREVLRTEGLLTVDSRVKERKKYGQRGARRKFQFVKR